MDNIISFQKQSGLLIDRRRYNWPYLFYSWGFDRINRRLKLHKNKSNTNVIYFQNDGVFHSQFGTFSLRAGMSAQVPGDVVLERGSGFVICVLGRTFPFAVAGAWTPIGNLKYIDGCTDRLLIGPSKKGEPCLNHLHFPKNIVQTAHYHPSDRVGIITKGRGRCITADGVSILSPGLCWVIPEGKIHKFDTDKPGEGMDIIAFHPETDFGPDDEDHPMINKTIVGGKSAKYIDAIRTK